jgi:hypothetical protein
MIENNAAWPDIRARLQQASARPAGAPGSTGTLLLAIAREFQVDAGQVVAAYKRLQGGDAAADAPAPAAPSAPAPAAPSAPAPAAPSAPAAVTRATRSKPTPSAAAPKQAPARPTPAAEDDADGRSKVAPYHHLLGAVPDRDVAKLAGVSVKAVYRYRARRRIPGFGVGDDAASAAPAVAAPPAPRPAPPRAAPAAAAASTAAAADGRRGSIVDAYAHLVGTISDGALAKRTGIRETTIYQYRRRRGILPFTAAGALPDPAASAEAPTPPAAAPAPEPEPAPAPTPAPATAATPTPVTTGAVGVQRGRSYLVTATRDGAPVVFAVVADSLQDAAARAARHLGEDALVRLERSHDALL